MTVINTQWPFHLCHPPSHQVLTQSGHMSSCGWEHKVLGSWHGRNLSQPLSSCTERLSEAAVSSKAEATSRIQGAAAPAPLISLPALSTTAKPQLPSSQPLVGTCPRGTLQELLDTSSPSLRGLNHPELGLPKNQTSILHLLSLSCLRGTH